MADLQSKKFGEAWVFWPIHCVTGAIYAQPQSARDGGIGVRIEAATTLGAAPDFVLFDERGALDAPECIPSGSVRSQSMSSGGALMVGHVYRDGWSAQ